MVFPSKYSSHPIPPISSSSSCLADVSIVCHDSCPPSMHDLTIFSGHTRYSSMSMKSPPLVLASTDTALASHEFP